MTDNRQNPESEGYLVIFGSDDDEYSDDGEDISGHLYWQPLLDVASKHGPALASPRSCFEARPGASSSLSIKQSHLLYQSKS